MPTPTRDDTTPRADGPLALRRHAVRDLDAAALEAIWRFHSAFFERSKDAYLAGLRKADDVYLATDRASGEIRGLVVLTLLDIAVAGVPRAVLYVNWTAIDPRHRGQGIVQRATVHAYARLRARRPLARIFLLATASTSLSYAALHRNALSLYPSPGRDTPAEAQALIDEGMRRLGLEGWSPARGVLERHGDVRYREGSLADARRGGHDADDDVAYFFQKNPHQDRGDSLACLTELSCRSWVHVAAVTARRALRRSRGARTALSALLAFVLYAAWTGWANRQLAPALLQGTLSATTTFFMAQMIERLHARGLGRLAAGLAPPNAVLLLSVAAHTLLGTPHVALTLLPNLLVSNAFGLAYATGLGRGAGSAGPPTRADRCPARTAPPRPPCEHPASS